MRDWAGYLAHRDDLPPLGAADWQDHEWQTWSSFPEVRPAGAGRPATKPPAPPPLTIPLPAPPPTPLADALHRRRSEREAQAPTLEQLWRAIHPLVRDGGVSTPSPGGVPLALELLARDVDGVPQGLYRCSPQGLAPMPVDETWIHETALWTARYLGRGTPAPAALLWRVQWSGFHQAYPGGGLLSAVWSGGAALQAAYLTASDQGLAGSASSFLPAVPGGDPRQEGYVANFQIGCRKELTEPNKGR